MDRRFGIMFLVVLAVAVLIAGAVGFNLGAVQGMAGAPVVAPATGAAPYVFSAPGYFYRPFGFGFLGCLFPFLGIFLVFGLLRFVFWGGGWRGGMHRRDWSRGASPMFEEWHRQAHGGTASTDAPKPTTEQSA